MIANIPIKYHINHFEIISKILKSHVQFIFTHNPQYRTRYKNSQQISRNIFLKKKKKERIGSYSNGSRRLLFSRHVGQLRLSHTHRPPAPSATLQSFLQVNSRAAETYSRIVRSPLPPPLFLSSSLRARFKQLNCTKQLLVSLLAVFSPR